MSRIKALLTGTALSLLLSSCGGGSDGKSELKEQVCRQFKEYRACAKAASADNLLECDKTYETQMRALSAENASAVIPTKEGFDYNDVQNTLNECVLNVETNPLDELKKCLLDFQDSVLEGLECA